MVATTTILVGTGKGAFLITGTDRAGWQVSGPHCDGWPINHVVGDAETGRLWAGGGDDWTGAGVWRSTDGGESWALSKLSNGSFDTWLTNDPDFAEHIGVEPDPPAPFTGTIAAIWSLNFADGTLYAGAKPAQLFTSRDGGKQFELVESLASFPGRDAWEAGAAGLTLHSIVPAPDDPQRMWLAISASGVFATEDGGQSWERRNRRANDDGMKAHVHSDGRVHEAGAETGLCVHNMVRAPGGGDTLYQQNHEGVFRSPDGGRSWVEITAGLPSGFGFPIAVHPHDPDTIWTIPLNGDMQGRYPPNASAAVWKSGDGGATWGAKQSGLPTRNCYFTVLRQAMATDRQSPAGVCFGTNTGSVFFSPDEGESWDEIARHLPKVLSVEVLERG
jgi:photosystem II stability/assembly factor-like uncharacterized protein